MSQRQAQLKLVFSSSKPTLKIENARSMPRRGSRRISSMSSFQRKIALLERERPEAAVLIERLVDTALAQIGLTDLPLLE